MNKSLWQRIQPHAIATGIFFIISCAYCLPAFKGLVVAQFDTEGWKGMAQQSLEYYEKYGRYPLWTNAIFSGMPAFQIAMESLHNITIAWLHHLFILFLPEPAGLFFWPARDFIYSACRWAFVAVLLFWVHSHMHLHRTMPSSRQWDILQNFLQWGMHLPYLPELSCSLNEDICWGSSLRLFSVPSCFIKTTYR